MPSAMAPGSWSLSCIVGLAQKDKERHPCNKDIADFATLTEAAAQEVADTIAKRDAKIAELEKALKDKNGSAQASFKSNWLKTLPFHNVVAGALKLNTFEGLTKMTNTKVHEEMAAAGLAGLAPTVCDGVAALQKQEAPTGKKLNSKFKGARHASARHHMCCVFPFSSL